ncbi:MAG: T9SS C-terminal target domain-containing protein [Cryomorphaceae bacterium]|nr:MAG: T9SS C-terminal target domain-containing protein [Cryomorphaceae bacterium]
MELTFKIMCRHFLLIWIWSVSAATTTGQTMDYFYDPGFTPPNVIGGSSGSSANSILVHADGRYTITGGFQFNAPYSIKKGVRFFNDGSIDESFAIPGDPISVSLMLFYQEGYLYRIPNTLVPVDANGIPPSAPFFDLSYVPYIPSAPPTPHVNMYQILEDNRILVAGRFSPDTNNLEDRRQLVRVHPDGSPDLTFEPLKCEEPFHTNLIDLYPTLDGKWMVTGEFNFIEGFESPNIARLNTDFSVDTTFQSPFPDYTWSVRIIRGSHPQKLHGAIDDQNRLYISRIEPGFAYSLLGLKHLRLLADGSIDSTFQVGELAYYNINDGEHYPGSIFTIAFEPDGSLIIGGRFRTVDGQPRGNIAKLNQDGSLVQNVFHRQGADTANWQNGSNPIINVPAVNRIVHLENGGLMVGGRFSRYDGHDQWGLVRLLPEPVSVEEHTRGSELKVFPNPAADYVWFEMPEEPAHEVWSLHVFDLTGALVLQESSRGSTTMQLSLTSLQTGMYVLQVSNGKSRYSQRIVKH